MKILRIIASVAGILALAVVATVGVVGAQSTPTAGAVAAQIADPAIQADMMIDMTKRPAPAGGIGRDQAEGIASAWLGRSDSAAVVTYGSGRVTAQDAPTPAWIVIFAGGQHPLHSDGSVTLQFIGVVIDDGGNVLRTFGRGHQN